MGSMENLKCLDCLSSVKRTPYKPTNPLVVYCIPKTILVTDKCQQLHFSPIINKLATG